MSIWIGSDNGEEWVLKKSSLSFEITGGCYPGLGKNAIAHNYVSEFPSRGGLATVALFQSPHGPLDSGLLGSIA